MKGRNGKKNEIKCVVNVPMVNDAFQTVFLTFTWEIGWGAMNNELVAIEMVSGHNI